MAQTPRNGAQHPPGPPAAAIIAGDRPLSFYDNLSSGAIVNGGTPGRVIQFPDIQFRFDESIPDRRSVHSSAKSDFFGLLNTQTDTPPPPPPPSTTTTTDGHRRTPPAPPPDQQPPASAAASSSPPAHDSVSASPSSTASTVPAQMSPAGIDSPRDSSYATGDLLGSGSTSTPRSSRPSSTIKTITIKLPDTAASGGGPSEAVYMTTTVPQNFTKNTNTLIGRHKPTRSSLRHSRMLVVNKTVAQRYPRGNALNLRHVRLSKVLMMLQILVGLALSLIGLAIKMWSPSTQTKDNPYWSGVVLVLCGTLFLLLFEFKRGRVMFAKRTTTAAPQQPPSHHPVSQRWRESCFHFLHVNALVVLLLTIFFTMLAFIYALIHTTNLSSAGLRCEPQQPYIPSNTSTCVCTIDTTPPEHGAAQPAPGNGTGVPSVAPNTGDTRMTDNVIRLEYRDFSCDEVHGIWYYVTITSALLNSAGCLLAATFLVIYAIECMRRPEQDTQQRWVACTGPTTDESTAVALSGRTAEDGTVGPPTVDASSVPLLKNAPSTTSTGQDQPKANTSIRSNSSTTTTGTARQPVPAEENTLLTTITSSDCEELEDLEPCRVPSS